MCYFEYLKHKVTNKEKFYHFVRGIRTPFSIIFSFCLTLFSDLFWTMFIKKFAKLFNKQWASFQKFI